MVYTINKHPFQNIKKYRFGGHKNREMIAERSVNCLVCGKTKEEHDKPLRIDGI